MTIALWCVMIGGLLPLAWTWYAKFTGDGFKPRHNYKPRDFLDTLEGARKRAHWAQLNSFEAFPPFAAAVLVATTVGRIDPARLDQLAIAWVILRVLYGVLYIADRAPLRSLVWAAATACWVAIFVLSA
ncbi:MAG: MAPEG family protein [Pseudomonadota bacterium]